MTLNVAHVVGHVYCMNITQHILINHCLLWNDMSFACYCEMPYGFAYRATPTLLCDYVRKKTSNYFWAYTVL